MYETALNRPALASSERLHQMARHGAQRGACRRAAGRTRLQIEHIYSSNTAIDREAHQGARRGACRRAAGRTHL